MLTDLLIIGDANHQYIANFCLWLKKTVPNLRITIISQTHCTEIADKIYDEVCVYSHIDGLNIISRILNLLLRYLFVKWHLIKKKAKYNTVFIHFVRPWQALIMRSLKRSSKNVVVALWGSDFYRAREKDFKKYMFIYDLADKIVIGSPMMMEDYKKKYPDFACKIELCYFGSTPIDLIKKGLRKTILRDENCDILGITSSKINIQIGHNGSRAHQHIKIIKELEAFFDRYRDQIQLIIPLTYGLSEDYKKELKLLCNSLSVDTVLLFNFMSDEEVAHLRTVVDVMVNLQTTDAFSSAMREVLYAGGIVINGSWLPYKFIQDLGVYYEEVASLHQLPLKLHDVLDKLSSKKVLAQNNREIIYKISSWKEVIVNWSNLLIRD